MVFSQVATGIGPGCIWWPNLIVGILKIRLRRHNLRHYICWREHRCSHLTMSDMRALKCWMASSLLCCSRSLSISLVCSDLAFCTSLSLSRRLASMRACLSNSRSFSTSTFCGWRGDFSFIVIFTQETTPLSVLLPWPVFPCTVCKVLLWVQSSPQPCNVDQSRASLSLYSIAGRLLHADHSKDQRSLA